MIDLKKIDTEKRNINTMNLSEMNAMEIVQVINNEDKKVAEAVNESIEQIAIVVDEAANTLKNNGRIIYIGAGTSGRLGVLDAVECPPTFGVSKEQVIGLIAGGEEAFLEAVEGAEDSKELAMEDLKNIRLTKNDYVIGIAPSGRTPYVIGGLEYAKSLGVKTASIAITSNSEIGLITDVAIEVIVGPEVLTGSTRMKAGTARKMILNMISTGAMVLNGKVYQNLMVDVQQTNLKLQQRALNIIMQATDCDEKLAKDTLKKANNNVKIAIVMILDNLDYNNSIDKLSRNNGFIK